MLAGIPTLVAQGLRKADIAKRLGCKESTLQVRCSNAGISLRGRNRMERRFGGTLTLSHEASVG
jgi:DNA-binding NarL/FixJ family response regulator